MCDCYPSTIVHTLSDFSEKESELVLLSWSAYSIGVQHLKAGVQLQREISTLTLRDKCLDPLMCTYMRDPVRLPSSQQIVDRRTIEQHLEFNAYDPFTRTPLNGADLEAMPKLQEQIRREVTIAYYVKQCINTGLQLHKSSSV
jgi:hypothetical protein